MSKPLTFSAAFLLLAACAMPADDPNGRPGSGDGPDDALDLPDGGDPADEEPAGDDDDGGDDGSGDRTDPPDEVDPPEEEEGWDPTPPDMPDGSILEGVLNCALLDGPHPATYVKDGDLWLEAEILGNGPFPELRPCMERGAPIKYLEWTDEPFMYIAAAGLHHDLWPTEMEDRWFGEVYPIDGDSSAECLAGLDQFGLTWPVPMSFEVLSVTPPE